MFKKIITIILLCLLSLLGFTQYKYFIRIKEATTQNKIDTCCILFKELRAIDCKYFEGIFIVKTKTKLLKVVAEDYFAVNQFTISEFREIEDKNSSKDSLKIK
jgi:hypothetical protein